MEIFGLNTVELELTKGMSAREKKFWTYHYILLRDITTNIYVFDGFWYIYIT